MRRSQIDKMEKADRERDAAARRGDKAAVKQAEAAFDAASRDATPDERLAWVVSNDRSGWRNPN